MRRRGRGSISWTAIIALLPSLQPRSGRQIDPRGPADAFSSQRPSSRRDESRPRPPGTRALITLETFSMTDFPASAPTLRARRTQKIIGFL